MSMGRSSNYAHAHFWNQSDEQLKSNKPAEGEGQDEPAALGGSIVLFYEAKSQMFPRTLMLDF